ncbi:MAG: Hpt domain-containing protein [Phycisphaerales bacterium]|nr:Hpt domain-containing protein [Phycisphaerales bacterium]
MDETANKSDVLLSEFADDADMAELVEFFVTELPDRVSALQEALAQGNYAKLASLAHQLKGSAGGYGFPSITEAAKQLEDTSKTTTDLEKLTEAANALVELCGRVRAS